jgi:glycosyltransferase involved in cell wall biosynthesis
LYFSRRLAQLRAIALLPPPLTAIVAGDGTQRTNLERLVEELDLSDRVTLLGAVDDDTLIDLYRHALAVVYPPYDEDYGYVTLEAFLARKPVVTTRDAGGPLEFVEDGVNGWICDPDPHALAGAIARLADNRAQAASFGDAGCERAKLVTWDGVIDHLVGEAEEEPARG